MTAGTTQASEPTPPLAAERLLLRVVRASPNEVRGVVGSFFYCFFLLASYTLLRPVRDAMGLAGGMERLAWLFLGTFLAILLANPLWSYLASRLPRARLLPLVYRFFIANLLIFWALFHFAGAEAVVGRAFFIWLSVFNLFAVSVFWSFMVDVFREEQAKRLFGFIAAGGSAGALVGPILTAALVASLGPAQLLLLAALGLEAACRCMRLVVKWHHLQRSSDGAFSENSPSETVPRAVDEQAVGGGILSGMIVVFRSPLLVGIALYVMVLTLSATFGYFLQGRLVSTALLTSSGRMSFFARVDLLTNVLALLVQAGVTGRLLRQTHVRLALPALPALTLAGFLLLAAAPSLALLTAIGVGRRAAEYALARPARDVLFTRVNREQKYKSKPFIDTVVYRLGDALGGWVYTALAGLGLSISGLALCAVPLSLIGLVTAGWLSRRSGEKAIP